MTSITRPETHYIREVAVRYIGRAKRAPQAPRGESRPQPRIVSTESAHRLARIVKLGVAVEHAPQRTHGTRERTVTDLVVSPDPLDPLRPSDCAIRAFDHEAKERIR